MNLKNKKNIFIFLVVIILITSGFTSYASTPKKVYRVYLKGESIGLIESKQELEDYINVKQEEIKRKYKVKKVYLPEDLDIVKETTYSKRIRSIESVYEEIKDKSPFTISGYLIKMRGIDSKDANGKTIKGKTQKIYVIKKNVFTDSVERTAKSFIPEESYDKYANDTQEEIKETGTIIEQIYIKNKITIKKQNIPVTEKIYMKEDELSKYLLFGTTKDQSKYIVKEGDTIYDIAFNNKISTEEFLIANPDLSDENSLLSAGQEVTLGILNPQFSVVEEDYTIKDEESNYQTETIQDPEKCNTKSEVTQAGVKGLNRVSQRIQKVNGETTNTVTVSTEVLKDSIKEIVTKGTKNCSAGWGSGAWSNTGPLPSRGYFGWPATCSSITSPYGYRWGALHDGTDIAGCGYGSPIYAAAEGTVVTSSVKWDNGEYVVIQHPNGYYTLYAHMCSGCRYVHEGQYVYKGQVIGGMGQTGWATGVHVHFSVWGGYPYRGPSYNPMSFF